MAAAPVVVLICCVPELGPSGARVADEVERAVRAPGRWPTARVTRVLRPSRAATLAALGACAAHVRQPGRRALVYYYGHGEQVRDANGDEADGRDEVWATQRVTDDELSRLFGDVHATSRLFVVSDACSSGTMIDRQLNGRPWATISSAADPQDALATSDGGAFTVWGLLPALRALRNPTPRQLHAEIARRLDLPTQTSVLDAGQPAVLDEPMF
jgi:hypothetical protein